MERAQKILYALLLVFIHACQSEQAIPPIRPSLKCTIQSRGENSPQHLPAGSQILLNANGGLELENETFTYNGNIWENGKNFQWTDPQKETNIIALHPIYADNLYTSENIYSNGMLEDVLIARKTLTGKEMIELQFEHLFSMLTLHVENDILEELKELRLTIPAKIGEISTQEGTFSIIDEPSIATQSNNGSNDYSFILPPIEECILTLTLVMADNIIHEMNLAPHSFRSGTRYECNLLNTDTRPGIRTAEDLIIFSQLINGTYKGNKTLSDFGEQIGGETIYRLLADISMTKEECSQFAPIGRKESTPFSYTFDGEGHTISNFILPNNNLHNSYSGLFGYVASTGIIKNLILTNASSSSTPAYTKAGIIASNNKGIINNCSVTNSIIYSAENGFTGLICCQSSGTIINSHTENNTLHVVDGTASGGICGSASGKILNSYSYKNKFSTSGSGYRTSGIVGASSTSTRLYIENNYTYIASTPKYWGGAVGNSNNVSIKYFYYNLGNLYNGTATNTTQSNAKKYDAQYYVDSVHISTLLNEWIETTGKSQYPQYTFRQWTTASDGSPCFK